MKKIFCTLGPASLNKDFLNFSNKKISLLRLNMSHVKINDLEETIRFIRKNSNVPICIDTEGAQIRTKVNKKKIIKKNQIIKIYQKNNKFNIYPKQVFNLLKKNDILDVGFEGLKIKIQKISSLSLTCRAVSSGLLANNKGVHLVNRKIKLNYITEKDKQAILIGKKMNIKNYALSFTNSYQDILKFNKLIKKETKIFKLETKAAIKNLNKIIKNGENFLIDRGDLSKDVSIELLPVMQRKILKIAKREKKNVYIATNFLESMIENSFPTRGEANDIYNTLETGAAGLVLAAETAIGKYPKECVTFLRKMIKTYSKFS